MTHPARWRAALCAALAIAASAAWSQDKYPTAPGHDHRPPGRRRRERRHRAHRAQKLTELNGQQFLVENRPGAGGNIGIASVSRAKPDGYTVLITADSAYVINPSLYRSTGFDPVKEFDPVATVATSGYVLVANKDFPPNNVAELIAAAKAQPGKIAIGSAGNGTVNHLVGEMLNKAAGIDLTHVPYKGASAAVNDLVGGQVQVSVQSLPSSISFIRSGRIKVLGVVNEKRLAALPDAAPISDTVKGVAVTPWYRRVRSRGDAEADRCAAARRHRQGARSRRRARQTRQCRRRTLLPLVRSVLRPDPDGTRTLGEGGEGLRRQGRLSTEQRP